MAQRVPEFGGAYVDSAGVINMYLTDTLARERAATALREMMKRQLPRPFVFVPARFSFTELEWYWEKMLRRLPRGLVAAGIDEPRNQLRITVIDEKARRAFLDTARQLEIPEGAIRVELGKPVVVGSETGQ